MIDTTRPNMKETWWSRTTWEPHPSNCSTKGLYEWLGSHNRDPMKFNLRPNPFEQEFSSLFPGHTAYQLRHEASVWEDKVQALMMLSYSIDNGLFSADQLVERPWNKIGENPEEDRDFDISRSTNTEGIFPAFEVIDN